VQRTGKLGEPSLVYLLPKKRTPEERREMTYGDISRDYSTKLKL